MIEATAPEIEELSRPTATSRAEPADEAPERIVAVLIGEERNRIEAMPINPDQGEPLCSPVAPGRELVSADIALRSELSLANEERNAAWMALLPAVVEGAHLQLLDAAAEVDEAFVIPMDEAELPAIPESLLDPERAHTPRLDLVPLTSSSVKPPPMDIAGVLPFVQKRRQREYDELRREMSRLDGEVMRLARLHDERLRDEGDQEISTIPQSIRRLRESMTSEDLESKRKRLAELKEQVAYMEARFPVLARAATKSAERQDG